MSQPFLLFLLPLFRGPSSDSCENPIVFARLIIIIITTTKFLLWPKPYK